MSELDKLLTLAEASERFFAGRVKAPGLRRERDRGNLTTIFVAGKEFTTPRHIQEMVKRCEKMPRDGVSALRVDHPRWRQATIDRPWTWRSRGCAAGARRVHRGARHTIRTSRPRPREGVGGHRPLRRRGRAEGSAAQGGRSAAGQGRRVLRRHDARRNHGQEVQGVRRAPRQQGLQARARGSQVSHPLPLA